MQTSVQHLQHLLNKPNAWVRSLLSKGEGGKDSQEIRADPTKERALVIVRGKNVVLVSKLEIPGFDGWTTWWVRSFLCGGTSGDAVVFLGGWRWDWHSSVVTWTVGSSLLMTPGWVVQPHAGGKGCNPRELGRLEMWDCASLRKLSKVLHKSQANPHPKSLGGERGESSSQ